MAFAPVVGMTTGLSPRVRGNQARHMTQLGAVNRGLSPRVRGNPVPSGTPDVRAGSIPARAGEPTSSASV